MRLSEPLHAPVLQPGNSHSVRELRSRTRFVFFFATLELPSSVPSLQPTPEGRLGRFGRMRFAPFPVETPPASSSICVPWGASALAAASGVAEAGTMGMPLNEAPEKQPLERKAAPSSLAVAVLTVRAAEKEAAAESSCA